MRRFIVEEEVVPQDVVSTVLRRLLLEIVSRGLTPEEIHDWSRSTWFPWLRSSPEVEAITPFIEYTDRGRWAEPQILMRFPDWPNEHWRMTAHIDELPPWADGERYEVIVGVALTDQTVENGCLHVLLNEEWVPVPMKAGDAVFMDPDLPHSGGLNYSDKVRVIVYFRYLVPA